MFKAHAHNGEVLQHAADKSMGDVYKFIPELKLRAIAEASPEYLLTLLKHRATTPLTQQYQEGSGGRLGDHLFILDSMRTNNFRHKKSFPYSFTLFVDDDSYGDSYKSSNARDYAQVMAGPIKTATNAGLCVPQSTGELILSRQMYILQALNSLVEDILDGSSTRNKGKTAKRSKATVEGQLSSLSIAPKPQKLSMKDLQMSSMDIHSSILEHLTLCRTEPSYLAHNLNLWFFSRPELLADEKGRHLPMHTDKYISLSFFDLIHEAVAGPTTWDYPHRLLQLLDSQPNHDKVRRNVILQEISSVCHLEFTRVQALFKRDVQIGCGSKLFKRVSGALENGKPKTSMKMKPDALAGEDKLLHCVMKLCQPETTALGAIDWIQKLDGLIKSSPHEMGRLNETEFDHFSDLAAVALFTKAAASTLSLPPAKKKGQVFAVKSKDLADELNVMRTKIDLSKFVVPIDNLREPGMAKGALQELEDPILEQTGTRIGVLCQDLIDACLADVEISCCEAQAEREQHDNAAAVNRVAAANLAGMNRDARMQARREKEKTRPAHPSTYDLAPAAGTPVTERARPSEPIKVKQSSYDVFDALLSRGHARGSVAWTDFEAAMTDVGFSVKPLTGSIYAFTPPEKLQVDQHPISLHRPHGSEIEGYKMLFFASRLKRVFGWTQESFEVA